jgi:hypothetical protein
MYKKKKKLSSSNCGEGGQTFENGCIKRWPMHRNGYGKALGQAKLRQMINEFKL